MGPWLDLNEFVVKYQTVFIAIFYQAMFRIINDFFTANIC